jgi:hypothetical protein
MAEGEAEQPQPPAPQETVRRDWPWNTGYGRPQIERVHKELKVTIPDWISTAVEEAARFALRENAARFVGDRADLYHGHVLVPQAYGKGSVQEQLDHGVAILFHTQEHLDSQHYGMDKSRRNLLYSRKSGQVELLSIDHYPHTEEGLGIDPRHVCQIDRDRLGEAFPGPDVHFYPQATTGPKPGVLPDLDLLVVPDTPGLQLPLCSEMITIRDILHLQLDHYLT